MCENCLIDDEVVGEYTQCTLQKGNVWQVAFIPTKFAKLGESIKLKVDNQWDDGWVVKATYKTISREVAQANYDNHKRFERVLNKLPAKRPRK